MGSALSGPAAKPVFTGRAATKSSIARFTLALLLFFPTCTVAEEFSAPLKKQGSGFYVEAVLNGNVKANLLVDTGSTFLVISKKLAGQLGFGALNKMPRYPVSTIADVRWARLVVLDKVSVGGAVNHSVEGAVIKKMPNGIGGLLGASFLKDFVYTVDGPGLTLLLKSSLDGKIYGGHNKKWWRGRFVKYSEAVKKYKNWLDMLESGFHRTKTFTGEDLSQREVSALMAHYKRLLEGLRVRARSFGVPASWVAYP